MLPPSSSLELISPHGPPLVTTDVLTPALNRRRWFPTIVLHSVPPRLDTYRVTEMCIMDLGSQTPCLFCLDFIPSELILLGNIA